MWTEHGQEILQSVSRENSNLSVRERMPHFINIFFFWPMLRSEKYSFILMTWIGQRDLEDQRYGSMVSAVKKITHEHHVPRNTRNYRKYSQC